MTTLCPTCNNTLTRKFQPAIGEDVLRCRVCNMYTVEGSGQWLLSPNVQLLQQIIKQRDDDARRMKEMITSPITDPRWTQIFI